MSDKREQDIALRWNTMTFQERLEWLLDAVSALLKGWSASSWDALPTSARVIVTAYVRAKKNE